MPIFVNEKATRREVIFDNNDVRCICDLAFDLWPTLKIFPFWIELNGISLDLLTKVSTLCLCPREALVVRFDPPNLVRILDSGVILTVDGGTREFDLPTSSSSTETPIIIGRGLVTSLSSDRCPMTFNVALGPNASFDLS